MESFIFNNVSSDDLGLIIKEMPAIVRPAKDIESIKINGRNGNLHIDNGTYDSYNITIKCIINDLTKLDQCKSVLQGTGELEISTVPNRTFKATIKNQLDFSKYLMVLREFPLQLEMEPFSYGETHEPIFVNDRDFEIDGNIETYPQIFIYQAGIITINNIQIQTLENRIKIDCELMECVKIDGNIDANSSVILTEFPKLTPGTNHISVPAGTVVEIVYKDRWL